MMSRNSARIAYFTEYTRYSVTLLCEKVLAKAQKQLKSCIAEALAVTCRQGDEHVLPSKNDEIANSCSDLREL